MRNHVEGRARTLEEQVRFARSRAQERKVQAIGEVLLLAAFAVGGKLQLEFGLGFVPHEKGDMPHAQSADQAVRHAFKHRIQLGRSAQFAGEFD